MLLKLKNINKHFSGVHALNNVSFDIEKGTTLALVGSNGAGKSTLMKCITGAIRPDSGEIVFNDAHLKNSTPKTSRQAGIEMIYQNLAHCRMQDVATNIFLGREEKCGVFLNHKKMHSKCQEIFEELGITIPSNATVQNLSGGQQQAVAIARAMLSDPKLLIMDEPTAALGAKETELVLHNISSLKERGVSIIIITHRLADVFKFADRIVLMGHGEVKYDLSVDQTNLRDLTEKVLEN